MKTNITNEDWDRLIKERIKQVGEDTSPLPAVTIKQPDTAFAQTVDHTLLKPDATRGQVDQLCDEALEYKFKSCCVNGCYVKQVATRLRGSSTIPCAVIGFPLGASTTAVKAFEARNAVADGAREIDMVISIGALKSGDYAYVFDEIKQVVSESQGYPVKVIIETVFLSDEEKIAASFIAAEAGAEFVKTCTGFLGGGATVEDVTLIKRTVPSGVKVKASGGIRSFDKSLEMLNAGADRIGSSSGRVLMRK